jgi:transposase
MPQNFLYPQRDQPLLLPADMREWLPEDDLVFMVLDAVAALDLGGFRRRYRAGGHGRVAFDPEMMVALLLYGCCQGERSSRVIERRCVRGVAYRVIAGGLSADHATIARFRARHERALGGLFSQVLRLLAAEGMVSLGMISLDGAKLAGNAAQKANRTLPAIGKLLAEAAAAGAAEAARPGGKLEEPAPRALARRAERRERLAAARDRLAAEDAARRQAQRARQEARDAAAADRRPRPAQRPADEPRTNRNNTEPRANITDPDVRVMRSQKGYVAGYNGQLVVTAGQVIVGAMLSRHPVDRTLLHPLLDTCRQQLAEAGIEPRLRTVLADAGYVSEDNFARADADGLRLLAPLAKDPGRRHVRAPRRARHLDRFPATARARRRLRHPRGRDDYKLRARTVEPVFGQLKACQKVTMMSRPGLAACQNEWPLACAAHNLRKLHRHRMEARPPKAPSPAAKSQNRLRPTSGSPVFAFQIPSASLTWLCATGCFMHRRVWRGRLLLQLMA